MQDNVSELKNKLHEIAFNYYKKIYNNGIHAPILKGRLEAAKEIASIFIDDVEIKCIIENAKKTAK
jgi:hypothetical protein